jgi:osmoprotectant transport system substrate-binding protein
VCLVLVAVLLTACAADGRAVEPEEPPVRVAAGPDAESVLLGHTMVALLEAAGLPGEVVRFADARDARRALDLGEVEVRVGYTGETWLETMGRADPPGDPEASYRLVREHDAQAGIVWMRPVFADDPYGPPANATFAFVVQGPPSIDADLRTMSQLAARLSAQPDALVCVDREFAERPDGLSAVLSAYSVRSDRPFLAADPAEAVLGVAAGDCLAGLTTATDGEAWRFGLHPLVDDLRVFPAFVPLPQMREDAIDARPGISAALGPMPAQLSTPMLGRLNARVRAGEPVDAVAREAAETLRIRSGLPPAPADG